MIRNIIFDIGNVLVDFCWRDHIRSCGYTGETAGRLGAAMMQSAAWREMDRGVWPEEEVLAAFIRMIRHWRKRSAVYMRIWVR